MGGLGTDKQCIVRSCRRICTDSSCMGDGVAGWGTRLEGICGLGVQRWVWVVARGGGKG